MQNRAAGFCFRERALLIRKGNGCKNLYSGNFVNTLPVTRLSEPKWGSTSFVCPVRMLWPIAAALAC